MGSKAARQSPVRVGKTEPDVVPRQVGCGPRNRPRGERPIRRIFPADYKLSILAEYDAYSEPGERGGLLRREGLYSSLISRLAASAPRRHPAW